METDQASTENASPLPSSVLSRQDYENFLVHVYFPMDLPREGFMEGCINRAYLDFNRTLHRLSKVESQKQLHERAKLTLSTALGELRAICKQGINEGKFDEWHKQTCDILKATYEENRYPDFCCGQAQKWINMSLKYIFVLGEERVNGFGMAYPFCHVPIDNIILAKLEKQHGFPSFTCAWSRIKVYDEYLRRQKWIRNKFLPLPLDAEFKLWMGEDVQVRNGE